MHPFVFIETPYNQSSDTNITSILGILDVCKMGLLGRTIGKLESLSLQSFRY